MDFLLNADQDAILSAVGTLLSRHAGVARLRELGGDAPTYDDKLDAELEAAGFLDIIPDGQAERLNAALVQESISMSLGCTSSSFRLLVAPSLGLKAYGPISVVDEGHTGPSRFAGDAELVVAVGSSQVSLIRPSPNQFTRPKSRLGWPVGQIDNLPVGETLSDVDPDEVRAWSRIALAIEMVGAMRFALDLTVTHVTDRKQFNRAIGSFQAVQHGLAECAIAVEAARWLTLEAAWLGSHAQATLALTQAIEATRIVFPRTHQYSGAIGFTEEYDLHLATMRLPSLRAEAIALGRPARDCVTAYWG